MVEVIENLHRLLVVQASAALSIGGKTLARSAG
jgi:hypothetical protein